MMHIKVWADIDSSGLFDETGRYYLLSETSMSINTWNALQDWVKDYALIVPMSLEERRVKKEVIRRLDEMGINIMKKISEEWPSDLATKEPIEFNYYSEGLMKYL